MFRRLKSGVCPSGFPDRTTIPVPDCDDGLWTPKSQTKSMKTQTNIRTLATEARASSKKKSKTQPGGGTEVMTRADASAGPSYDDIAARAYAIWKAQGCPEGRENEHWREAEEELMSRTASRKG
jgi:hypothetical protein